MLVGGLSGGDSVNLASFVVGLVGFSIAIVQLTRTANASVATQKAVERTEERMALNHLLVLIPQFVIIENEIDVAAEENDRKLGMRALQSWNRVASEAAGLLREQLPDQEEFVAKLEESARSASRAKADLIDKPSAATKSVTRQLRADLAELSSTYGSLVSRFRLEAGRKPSGVPQ